MDGAHDMGGVWSGPVQPEPNEPPFHAEWERRAFALTLAMAWLFYCLATSRSPGSRY